MLTAAGVILLGAILWATADWLTRERQRVSTALPRAMAQLQQLQHDAHEFAVLKNKPSPVAARTTMSLDQLQARFAAHGVRLELTQEAGGIRCRGEVSFDAWVRALAALQSEAGMRVERLSIARRQTGLVIVDASFAPLAQP